MAVTGGIIQASDYNFIQADVEKILGESNLSDPLFGYGQAVNSFQVTNLTDTSIPNGNSVTTNQINNLLNDIKTIYRHQNGVDLDILSYQVGDIVGADASGTNMDYQPDDSRSIINIDDNRGINDLAAVMSGLVADPFKVALSETDTQVAVNEIRSQSWVDTIVSEFTFSWSNAAERRHFFNSGGQIQIEGETIAGTSDGTSQLRDEAWTDLLENVGKIIFDYEKTENLGSPSGISKPNGNIHNYNISNSYQTILRKDASAGLYENSYWQIEARENSDSVLNFRVTLVNRGPESNPDEGVPGGIEPGVREFVTIDVSLNIGYRKSNGAVVSETPSLNFTSTLSDSPAPTFVAQPSNQSPNNNAVVASNIGINLTSSDFVVNNGTDTHSASQWRVRKSGQTEYVFDQSTDSGLTSFEVPSTVFDDVRGTNQDYEWQVRHRGTESGWSDWSSLTRFTASKYATFTTVLSSNIQNFVLYDELRDNWNWDETQQVSGSVTVSSSAIVGSSSNTLSSLLIDNIPSGSIVTINNSGRITGAGGDGSDIITENPQNGSPGGSALETTLPVTINNGSGIIAGGGGGGGAGFARSGDSYFASGGGGAGFVAGAGGNVPPAGTFTIVSAGSNGTTSSGGAGGSTSQAQGGAGGNPGQFGQPGDTSSGGAPGNSIIGISNVNWASGSDNILGPTS